MDKTIGFPGLVCGADFAIESLLWRNKSKPVRQGENMSTDVRMLSVFLAAPKDVQSEQVILGRFIDEWNRTSGPALKLRAELLHWSTHATPALGIPAQEVVNREILDNSDIVVGIFWSRFGSPTRIADSGTEEELRRSIANRKPVLLYFSDREVRPSDFDKGQYDQIQAFKREFRDSGLYWTFNTEQEFESAIRTHLSRALARFPSVQREQSTLRVAIAVVSLGHKVLMVQRRDPEGKLEWQFPAGMVKPKQDSRRVASETVRGETGVKCSVTKLLGTRQHPDTGVMADYYLCRYSGGRAINRDKKENATVKWVQVSKVNELVTSDLFEPVRAELARVASNK